MQLYMTVNQMLKPMEMVADYPESQMGLHNSKHFQARA
jgi:hypothetical protein